MAKYKRYIFTTQRWSNEYAGISYRVENTTPRVLNPRGGKSPLSHRNLPFAGARVL
jgi:hypothetical protein